MADSNSTFDSLSSSIIGDDERALSSTRLRLRELEPRGHNLISFLEAVQYYNIDLLSVSWQPGLGNIGKGGTASIFQSLVNANTTFAFKQCLEEGHDLVPNHRNNLYRKLQAEVMTLGHPCLRQHPNIVDLIGIGWDIHHDNDTAYPVLVTEKTESGDLEVFLGSMDSGLKSLDDMLVICSQIAVALDALHLCGIVHGDLKPKNVLIFRDSNGTSIPKLTDFGFSAFEEDENNGSGICLPRSFPFNAPEFQGQLVTFEGALRMEAYSFGMLCLWALLHDNFASQYETSFVRLSFYHSLDTMKELKNSDGLHKTAQEAVDSSEILDDESKQNLRKLFDLTLHRSPKMRSLEFGTFATLLKSTGNHGTTASTEPFVFFKESSDRQDTHGTFEVSRVLYHLYSSEALVRKTVTTSLANIARSGCCRVCRENSLFQMALCYAIGFGVELDNHQSRQFLLEAGKAPGDLEEAMDTAQRQNQTYMSTIAQHLQESGHLDIDSSEFPPEVTDMTKIATVEEGYWKELSDIENSLGKFNFLHDRLSLRLLQIQIAKQDFDRALSKLSELERRSKSHEEAGDRHWPFLLREHRAQIQYFSGDYTAVEQSCRENLASRRLAFGEDHPSHLNSLLQLVRILAYNSKYAESEELGFKAVDIATKTMGAAHQDTMRVLQIVGNTVAYAGKVEKAEEIFLKAADGLSRTQGERHGDVIDCYTNLAEILRWQARFQESEEYIQKSLAALRAQLVPEHPYILNALDILALIQADQGRHAEAENTCREVISGYSRFYSEDHPDTINSINNLVLMLHGQEKYDEAEDLCRRVLKPEGGLPPQPHNYFLALHNLGYVLEGKEKYEEAESWYRKAFHGFLSVLPPDHPHVCINKNKIALMLHRQGKNEEAELFCNDALEITKLKNGDDHPQTFNCLSVLGLVNQGLGRHSAAVAMLRSAVEGCGNASNELGPDRPNTLQYEERLADVLVKGGTKVETEEAGKIYQRVYEVRKRIEKTTSRKIAVVFSKLSSISDIVTSDSET